MLPPRIPFADGSKRFVYTDERGQYVLDDDGERAYGVWLHPDKSQRRLGPLLWLCGLSVLCGVLSVAWWRSLSESDLRDGQANKRTIEQLQAALDGLRPDMADAAEAYNPADPGDITHIDTDAKAILEILPGVQRVEVLPAMGERTARIIQIADHHFVPYKLYAEEVRASKPSASDEFIRDHYARFLLRAEMVQGQQAAVLRCLIRHHGLRVVHVEGLILEGMEAYRETLALLADEEEAESRLRDQLAEVERTGSPEASAIGQRLRGLLGAHRRRRMELGAVGLLASEGLLDVQPLDDVKTLDAAEPVNGRLDPERQRKRDKAIVDRLDGPGVSVIVLGQDHDLADVVGDGFEVVRVFVMGLTSE